MGDMTSGQFSVVGRQLSQIRAGISSRGQTITSVSALLSSNIASTVLSALGGLLVARFLGPDETGSFRAFTIPLTYLVFLHLGTWDGLLRQIPYYVGKEMPQRVDALVSAAGAFNLGVSALVSCGFVCGVSYSLMQGDFYGVFGWLSQAVCCWEVFYSGYLASTYRTLNQFVNLAKIQVVHTILTFGMVFLLPSLRFYGLCARLAFPAIMAVWLYHRNRPLKVGYRFDPKALNEVIRIGLPLSFWGNLYTSLWIATESALVLSLSGVSALGLFSVAAVMRAGMNSLPMAIWQVMTPGVVASFARDTSVRNANTRIVWVTVGLTVSMVVLVTIASSLLETVVPLAIPMYIDGIPVMQICLWFSVVQAAFLPINVLFATGKTWLYGRSVLAGVFVFFLATYLLYPFWGGLLAVAVGSLLGRTARTLAAYVDLVMLTRREK